MKTIILNWNGGDSDAFTFLSNSWAETFRRHGKNVEILELTDPEWATTLYQRVQEGVDFVLSFQGMGTTAINKKTRKLIWDELRVPLICFQGDHPSFNPENHQLERDYCFHLHTEAEFARYANRHFRKTRPALFFHPPRMFFDPPMAETGEPMFVIIKNIWHPADMEAHWRKKLVGTLRKAYLEAAEALRGRIDGEGFFELHDAIDALIADRDWHWIRDDDPPGLLHQFHRNLDYYARSYRSVRVLSECQDLPLQVYGRGWERCVSGAPKNWSFHEGLSMEASQRLFYSRYGIIDVSAAKGLHDRAFRAMANGRGFLSSGYIHEDFERARRFDALFYDFRPGVLRARCEAVMADPEAHHALAREFADLYYETVHFRYLVPRLDTLAESVSRRRRAEGAAAG